MGESCNARNLIKYIQLEYKMVGKLGVIWLLVGEGCWLVVRINIRDNYNLVN